MNSTDCIALVDDDADVLLSAQLYLTTAFQSVVTFSHPDALLAFMETAPVSAVLLDMNYRKGENSGEEGLRTLQHLKRTYPQTEVVVMTAYAAIQLAVEAVKLGAFDFVVKPWQNEQLLVTLTNALTQRAQRNELQRQAHLLEDQFQPPEPLVGTSTAMYQVKTLMRQMASTPAHVLIQGERGTGKKLVAQHLHQQWKKDLQTPWIQVNLNVLPPEEQMATLFDAEKGKWVLAQGGTLLLEEVAVLTPSVQVELYKRLTQRNVPHLIVTSQYTVKELVEGQDALAGLYYALGTVEVPLPPLRERIEDLGELLDYFFERYARKYKRGVLELVESDWEALMRYTWPGNISELKHAADRAVVLNTGRKVLALDLLPKRNALNEGSLQLKDLERKHIAQVLEQNAGNVSHTARDLGITRAALYRRMEKFGL